MKYYSASTNGFYAKDVHDDHQMPGDVVDVTDEEWMALLDAQSQGKRIVAGVNNRPVAVERVPTVEEKVTTLLRRRNQALQETDSIVARHRDELELESATTLTTAQYRALQAWRAQLRRLPEHPQFPDIALPERPV